MVPVLSHGRLDGVLQKDASEVPELVAAAVLGTCRYLADPARVLVPFRGRARFEGAGRCLSERMAGVAAAEVAMWPPAPGVDAGGAPPTDGDGWADEDGAPVPAPDAVVTLHRPGRPADWVVVEAVGPDGRLSGARGDEDPGARLAAYWRAARDAAGPGGTPLAIVLVGTGWSVPGTLFSWTRDALRRRDEPPAPVYGLSWRSFAGCAADVSPPPRILSDLLDLLEGAWGLAEVQVAPWPAAPSLPVAFRPAHACRWPPAPVGLPPLPFLPGGAR